MSATIDEFEARQAETGVKVVPPAGFVPFPVREASRFRYQRAYRSPDGKLELRYRIDSFLRKPPMPRNLAQTSFMATLMNLGQLPAFPKVSQLDAERARLWFGADWHAMATVPVADRRDFSPDFDSACVLFFHKYGLADVYLIGLHNAGSGAEDLIFEPAPDVKFPK